MDEPALVLVGTTQLNADLRHQLPLETRDPLLFVAIGDRRMVVTGVLDEPRIRAVGDYEILLLEQLGRDELLRRHGSRAMAERQAMRRAIAELGVKRALVASDFPLAFARDLESDGVELIVDDAHLALLRRQKSDFELDGIRRAQEAADAAVSAALEVLSSAERRGRTLTRGGEPLEVDQLKKLVRDEVAANDAWLDEFILSHGEQTAIGHHTGEGALMADEPIIIDLWPTDRRSGCCTDMTRTIVVGEPPPEVLEWETLCGEALDRVLPALRPGAPAGELHTLVCEMFEEHGYRTPLSQEPGETLTEGFPYPLGHGLGLELHEPPSLRRGESSTLLEGEVLAVEPGLYAPGTGGYRNEDVYVVREDGPERIGDVSQGLLVL